MFGAIESGVPRGGTVARAATAAPPLSTTCREDPYLTSQQDFAPLIAIIGCDGSGKSTVSEEVLIWIKGYGPAELVHLGQQSGNVGRALARLPLVGQPLGRVIASKSASHRAARDKKTPGLLTALVISVFLLRRLHRFRRMMALRRRGQIIVADRYPQLESSSGSDGLSLSVATPGSAVVRWLARRERAAYEWMTSNLPDLVLRLNVDLETALARKPDHSREALARKVASAQRLKFNGAPITDIDANQRLDDVVAAAKEAVSLTMSARGYARQGS